MIHDERRHKLLEDGRERLVAQVRSRLVAGGEQFEEGPAGSLFGKVLAVTEDGVAGRTMTGAYSRWSLRGWLIGADAEKETSGFGVSAKKVKSWGRWAVGVGALTTAIVIAFLGWRFTARIQTSGNEKLLARVTKPGQRAKITLSDGSTITLNADSRIRYAKDFGTSRDIYLEGEALFAVANSSKSPFIVYTGNTSTRVLGTSFTVRRYSSDSAVRVVVAEGRVALQGTVLSAGEMALADGKTAVSVVRDVNISSALAWTNGRLVFENLSLRSAIPELERWYNIKVAVQDSVLLGRSITVSLGKESIPDVSRIISEVIEARGKVVGNHVFFSLSTR